jgi:hypothetical protein
LNFRLPKGEVDAARQGGILRDAILSGLISGGARRGAPFNSWNRHWTYRHTDALA